MVPDAAINALQAAMHGELVLPNHPRYDAERKIHNAMINRLPAVIACCASTADVAACVRFARNTGVPVTVRGAGHNVAGISIADDALMIDLSHMKAVSIDVASGTGTAEPGVTWAEFNNQLQPFGLAATGGYVGTTGVSGLTLGGGLGWMVRKYGCALDNLVSAEVVTAAGDVIRASSDENPDLFWGLRGGGGNFRIVTSFTFRVHPVGMVLAGLVLHPLSKAREELRFWREYEKSAPEEMTNGVVMFNAPAGLPLPEELQREPIVGIGGVCLGSTDEGAKLLRPLREFGPPAADMYQPMPYSAAQVLADFLWPRGLYGYWKSSFLTGLHDGLFEAMIKGFAECPARETVVVLEHNGDSAFDRVPEDATAFAHRKWPYRHTASGLVG
ncbi:MAG TPA: FAD-binding oxidoreductase [Terriglobales bacterium]|nr:FAD-binding oxidoreductase [Terriglobales bacterium]